LFRALGSLVPGTWTCLSPTRAPVDCPTDTYRVARWTPQAPMAGGSYVLDINPAHVPDVTDLAGSPFDGNLEFRNNDFEVTTSPS